MRAFITITVLMCLLLSVNAQVPSYVPMNGLVGYHDFNGSLVDGSGAGGEFENNGVVFEKVVDGTKTRWTARFDGTPRQAKYLQAKDPSRYRTTNYTYMLRFRANEFRPLNNGGINFFYQALLAFSPPSWERGAAYMFSLNQVDNSSIAASQWVPGGGTWVTSQTKVIELSKWYTAVVTYDGHTVKLYLDGNLIGEKQARLDYQGQTTFVLGGARDSVNGKVMGGFSGNIDDFAFWNRALTEDDVVRIQNEISQVPCANPREIAAVTLDSRTETTWKSPVLKKGVTYEVRGTGVWTPNGGFSDADCEYEYFDPCTLRGKSGGVRIGIDSASAMSDDLKLKPLETTIDCDSHSYTYQIVGEGKPLYVLFRDSEYLDNRGTINVVVNECSSCNLDVTSDSILGYLKAETHQVVTYALRSKPDVSYKWVATGGYILGASTNHYCDVIWGYDKDGSVCCIVSDSTCSDTLCVQTTITEKNTVSVDDVADSPTLVVRPNPVSDVLQIDSRSDIIGSAYELIDLTGRLILNAQGPSAQVSLTNLAEGVYHIVHRDATGQIIGMQRVVVRR